MKSHAAQQIPVQAESGLVRELGLLDSTMIVAGSMIGSGIFIVPAEISRHVGSGGWLLMAWVVTGLLTLTAALAYGELAAMMPQAGGQYVYLRESYSPLWGFLYGWTLFLVIQSGTIAAVAVAFMRFLGVLLPKVSGTAWIIEPINISSGYAISLSLQQLGAILMIALLTYSNTRGIRLGKIIQNTFTFTKTLSLTALVLLGLGIAVTGGAVAPNFHDFWTPQNVVTVKPDFSFVPAISATEGAFGLFIAFCVALVGPLFSSDAWNNITFIGGEVRNPKRNIALAMAFGTGLVTLLYVLANLAYLIILPLTDIQSAPEDRVAAAALGHKFGPAGAVIMAVAIMISTFGCNNGLILAGARVYFAMARDRLFFRSTGRLNSRHVPAMALVLQGIWTCLLVLPRTRLKDASGGYAIDAATGAAKYGNLYSNLLEYVVFSALLFYVLTIIGIFMLRKKRPDAERPYRAVGYPMIPALYILGASTIMIILMIYKTQTTWPGLVLVLSGIPVYALWRMVPKSAESAS